MNPADPAVPFDTPLLMIGCGNMGGAMLRRWIDAGADPALVTVVTRRGADVPRGVSSLTDIPADADPATVVLAVKPQQLDAVTPLLMRVAPAMLVSILAGVETATLAARCRATAIVRAMPNLPVAIGKGVTALQTDSDDPAVRAAAQALAAPLGLVEWFDDSAPFGAVTALAGCGPGFTFRFVDALAAAGVALGLGEDQSRRLAVATVAGSGALAASSHETPAALAERVASPGGTTRAGLDVLDTDGALVDLLTRTLTAAAQRNTEMAAAARG